MGGGPTTTTNSRQSSNSTSATSPYAPSQGLLNTILSQAGNISYKPSADALNAFGGMIDSGNALSSQFGGQYGNLASNLFSGAGLGSGVPGIQQTYQTAVDALTPYAQGASLDQQNPYLQQLLSTNTDTATNAVRDAFAKAGRSFSGMESKALGQGITNAISPLLFQNYNQQQQNQMNAANALSGIGINTSGALDAAGLNRMNAQLSAPGVVSALSDLRNSPFQALLAREQYKQGLPLQQLQGLSNLVLPIASGFGTTTNRGTATGMSTQQTASDPLQTGIGAGLGLLGLGLSPINPAGNTLLGSLFH